MALPSEDYSDRETRDSSKPLDGSDSFQNDALIPHPLSSLELFAHSATTGEDPSAQWASTIILYRPTPRPPPLP